MPESRQHTLDRVRRPRVHITYDVETLGSIVKTELPFVVGIMADLSGNGLKPGSKARASAKTVLKDRKYIEIDRDSFDTIMEKIEPQVKLSVKEEPGITPAFTDTLTFHSLDDFEPRNVLQNVEKLKKLFESRTRLSNLLAKLDGNPELQYELMTAIKDLFKPDTPDKTALDTYVNTHLHPTASDKDGGEGESETRGEES